MAQENEVADQPPGGNPAKNPNAFEVKKENSRKYKLDFYEALNKVQFEHTLISQRMGWLLTSEAFLLAAYFTICQKEYDSQAWAPSLKYVIPSIGLLSAAIFYASILAGQLAIQYWKKNSDPDRSDALTSNFIIHFLGDFPPFIFGPLFIGLWAFIVISDKKTNWSVIPVELGMIIGIFFVFILIWACVVWFNYHVIHRMGNEN